MMHKTNSHSLSRAEGETMARNCAADGPTPRAAVDGRDGYEAGRVKSYALYMQGGGKQICLGPLGSATAYSDVIDAVEKFDSVKRIPKLLHLVIEGETDNPQAAAQDIFKMLALESELDEDVIASLQSLKRMLSKAKGNVMVGES